MNGVTGIMSHKQVWTDYARHYLSDKCGYACNRARYILSCMSYGLSDYRLWECASDHNLVYRVEYLLVDDVWRKMFVYPTSMDFVDALDSLFISEDVFDHAFDTGVELGERFCRLYRRWNFTLQNFDLYVMQHQAICGENYMEE